MKDCFGKDVKIRKRGLANNSEVCYINSMIQIAASSSTFIKQLEQLQTNESEPLNHFIELLQCVHKSIHKSKQGDDEDVLQKNTELLKKMIVSIGWNKPSQQDAFDLLSALIKVVHNDLKKISQYIDMPMKIKLVHRFKGIDIPDKVQEHLGLSVGLCGDYSKRPGVSLKYLINEHFSPTIIDDDSSKTTQMFFYQQPPDVLLIHIQANKWDEKRGEMYKPKYYIIYKKKLTLTLNIVKTLGEKIKEKKVKYKLKGFVRHIGEISCGHYVSHRRHDKKWYLVDDEEVEHIKFDGTVVPYILIYEKYHFVRPHLFGNE